MWHTVKLARLALFAHYGNYALRTIRLVCHTKNEFCDLKNESDKALRVLLESQLVPVETCGRVEREEPD